MYSDATIPSKTPKALDTLKQRRGEVPLSARERQLLVVCDGRRSLGELRRMFSGGEPVAELAKLVQAGYLDIAPASPRPAPRPDSRRRSMAAAKMYMIDRLQLMRDAEAAALAQQIHAATDEALLVERLYQALALIRLLSGAGTGERVAQHLLAVLPEPHLRPALAGPAGQVPEPADSPRLRRATV